MQADLKVNVYLAADSSEERDGMYSTNATDQPPYQWVLPASQLSALSSVHLSSTSVQSGEWPCPLCMGISSGTINQSQITYLKHLRDFFD